DHRGTCLRQGPLQVEKVYGAVLAADSSVGKQNAGKRTFALGNESVRGEFTGRVTQTNAPHGDAVFATAVGSISEFAGTKLDGVSRKRKQKKGGTIQAALIQHPCACGDSKLIPWITPLRLDEKQTYAAPVAGIRTAEFALTTIGLFSTISSKWRSAAIACAVR